MAQRENSHSSTLPKRVSSYNKDTDCVDGKVLSTEEKLPDISLRQLINPNPDEKLGIENHSLINVDIHDFILRPYGCGYCDEVFEIEKTFMNHCYNHYSDACQKDTLLELIEMCLLT